MARSAKPRSSRTTRKPVTIDLEAEKVSEAKPKNDASSGAKSTSGVDTKKPEETSQSNQAKSTTGGESAKKDLPKSESKPAGGSSRPTPPKAASNTGMSSLTGGIIGGLIALIGGAGLQWVGVLPSMGPEPAPVEQVDLSPVQSEIDGLKAQIIALQESEGAAISDQAQSSIDAALGSSQEAIERTSTIEQALQSLDGKVGEIEASISAGAAGENAGLETLATRIAEVEGALAAVSANGDQVSPEIQSMVESLQSDLAAQTGNLATLQGTVVEQIASLEEKLAGMAEQIESRSSGANVAAAIASAGLKSAIDRGGSFMTELEAYASVAGDGEIVETLRNYAASGVATISQLSDQFPAVHNRIIAVGDGLDENAGVADRLMASARSLVQVRTVGDVEGDSPDQIAARIEARLKDSDLAAALVEWENLPDAAKEASADFAESLRARQTVDALVSNALSGAMAAAASN